MQLTRSSSTPSWWRVLFMNFLKGISIKRKLLCQGVIKKISLGWCLMHLFQNASRSSCGCSWRAASAHLPLDRICSITFLRLFVPIESHRKKQNRKIRIFRKMAWGTPYIIQCDFCLFIVFMRLSKVLRRYFSIFLHSDIVTWFWFYRSNFLSVCLSVYLSICLSVCLSDPQMFLS